MKHKLKNIQLFLAVMIALPVTAYNVSASAANPVPGDITGSILWQQNVGADMVWATTTTTIKYVATQAIVKVSVNGGATQTYSASNTNKVSTPKLVVGFYSQSIIIYATHEVRNNGLSAAIYTAYTH